MRQINKQLINEFLKYEINPNDLINYFDIVIRLLKRYGKNIITKNVLQGIKNGDQNIYFIIKLLNQIKKLNKSYIKSLIQNIKQKSSNYTPTFQLNIIQTSKKDEIQKKLKNKFPQSNIQTSENTDLGIFISGEGRYYKRDIDQDLKKLLG